MKRIILKKKTILLSLMLLLAVSLLCFGCAPDTEQPNEELENQQNEVYIVSNSSRTTNDWDMKYGAIKADGTMVLPMEYTQLNIISDIATGEPLWLQTYELQLKDEAKGITEVTDEMFLDYWQHKNDDSQYFHHLYKLYDLNGALVEELGDCCVRSVCGDFILYQDNRLLHRSTGEVLFDNAISIDWAEDCYIITYDQNQRVCAMDREQNIVIDLEGRSGFTDVNGNYYFVTVDGEKQGLCRMDGTQTIANEYDYIASYYSRYAPYVQAHKGDTTEVISLEDGNVVYQTSDEYEYVQEMFEDFMIIQKRYQSEMPYAYPVYQYNSQFYNYDGEPISDKYLSLSPQNYLYESTKKDTGEGVLLFIVTAQDGRSYLMNDKEEELYPISAERWTTVLNEERVIVTEEDGDSSQTRIYSILDDTALHENAYDSMNVLYQLSSDGYYTKSELVAGNYQYNNVWLQDVLDADGNIILERLKSVTMLSEDLFWVEKGFSQGLMDRDGNWLYEQSLFDGAADE